MTPLVQRVRQDRSSAATTGPPTGGGPGAPVLVARSLGSLLGPASDTLRQAQGADSLTAPLIEKARERAGGVPLSQPSGLTDALAQGRQLAESPALAPLIRRAPFGAAAQQALRTAGSTVDSIPDRLPLHQVISQAAAASGMTGLADAVPQVAQAAEPASPQPTAPDGGTDDTAPPPAATTATGAAPLTAATAALPAAAGGMPSGSALEELAQRLYEPLMARMRAELWLDRERSGLMVDLRR